MSDIDITLVPLRKDNYAGLLACRTSRRATVIDPGEAAPVLARLEAEGLSLTRILITHSHPDHTDGVEALRAATGCAVLGAALDAARLPPLTQALSDGDRVGVGAVEGIVLATPGHTHGHLAYHFPAIQAVFCGDCLFSLGCGRLFEGTAATMWHSLCRLRDLPGDTWVYVGHEYTEANLAFALSVDPDNERLRARADAIHAARRQGRPTVPVLLDEERATNPFLRADDPRLQKALGLEGLDPARVFATLRSRKDTF